MSHAIATAGPMPIATGGLPHDTALPAGEAGVSFAKVRATPQTLPPPGEVAIHEAGGGGASYLPAALVRRARVTVFDIDPTQIVDNGDAQTRTWGDVRRGDYHLVLRKRAAHEPMPG